ncbi:type IV pilus modification protein PilV [Pseudomonas linyingensis]|uniref:type IV pilus modification protein PilV n=1 Tax=Pseudomonas linyingensis TaxID=915471 RepID=UPI000B7F3CB8|nr:type IV pilus modification protein PilV [Pseudomonas linyingensis]
MLIMTNRSRQCGFSLIEVLVTLFILSVGLLGLAGLQSRILVTEFETYQRAQAMLLAQNMANRIKANPAAGRASNYSGDAVYGVGNTLGASGCSTTAQRHTQDLCNWNLALQGAAVQSSDDVAIGGVMGARGCIERLTGTATTAVVLRVTVAWQGMAPLAVPSLACGQGLYGTDDSLRRTVSMLVSLAYLGG